MSNSIKLPTSLDEVPLPQTLPPIMLPVFTRPDLLKNVLDSIAKQSLLPPQIIAFVDGARNARQKLPIEECIKLLQDLSSLIPVKIVTRAENLGCDRNVILGFTEVLSEHLSVVYLEDDTVPNQYFYERICRLLEAYKEHKEVFSITGYASISQVAENLIDKDFFASHRVFSWGFGIWADRWQEIDLVNKSPQYNPFGAYYKIPATVETKLTMMNQFWTENNQEADWVITLNLAALYHNKVHLIPRKSLVYNIGFGHPEAKNYKGPEQAWVNTQYDSAACPNSLPSTLELLEVLSTPLDGTQLVQHLAKQKSVWLNPSALIYFLQHYPGWSSWVLFLKLFVTRLPIMLKRWRSGLPI